MVLGFGVQSQKQTKKHSTQHTALTDTGARANAILYQYKQLGLGQPIGTGFSGSFVFVQR